MWSVWSNGLCSNPRSAASWMCNFGQVMQLSCASVPHVKKEHPIAPASQGSREHYIKFKCKTLMKEFLANNALKKKVNSDKLLLFFHLLISMV